MQTALVATFFLLSIVTAMPSLAADQTATLPSKVLVARVFDKSCLHWCEQTKNIVDKLAEEYKDRADFVDLDATRNATGKVLPETMQRTDALGITSAFKDSTDYLPVVLIFDVRRKLVKELVGPKKEEPYRAAIEKALQRDHDGKAR